MATRMTTQLTGHRRSGLRRTLIALTAAGALLAAGCSSDSDDSETTSHHHIKHVRGVHLLRGEHHVL